MMRLRKLGHLHLATGMVVFIALMLPSKMAGQTPTTFNSREVHPDGTITFRYRDTGAKQVQVSVESLRVPIPMTRVDGIWTATTPPLSPETYWYWFIVDGRPEQRVRDSKLCLSQQ
jgi:hypothetical protein